MIRWSYLGPRLVLVGTLLAVLWFGVDPLVRWTFISAGETITAAKIEIGGLKTSLAHGQLTLSGVAVADPGAPMKNLFEADEIVIQLEARPLGERKCVIDEARINGLRLGTDRQTSGALGGRIPQGWLLESEKLFKLGDRKFGDLAEKALERLAAAFEYDAAKQIEQLESVRLIRDLAIRWAGQYDQMEARADDLKRRVDDVGRIIQGGASNLLQGIEAFRQATLDLEKIRRDMTQLAADLEQLPAQIVRDKDAVAAAQQRDLARIAQQLQPPQLDAEGLSDYLLGAEITDRVEALAHWIAWGRRHLPRQGQDPDDWGLTRARGVDLHFGAAPQYADFLVRRLAVTGEAMLGQEPFRFSAIATELTSQPDISAQPAELKIRVAAGKVAAQIDAVVDHTGPVPRECLRIDCPALPQAERTLGQPDRLALTVAPGNTYLWVLLNLTGDKLTGKVQMQQDPVQLSPRFGPRYGGQSLAETLGAVVQEIRAIQVEAELSGTLAAPACKIQTDLGVQLVDGFNTAIQRELEARCLQVNTAVSQRIRGDLDAQDRLLAARHQAVGGKRQLGDTQIQQLGQTVAQRTLPGAAPLTQGILNKGQQILGKDLPVSVPVRLPLRF